MTVIAMSHEIGTHGRVIATMVAQRLGLAFVDEHSLECRIADRLACHNRLLNTLEDCPDWLINRLSSVDDRKIARSAEEEIFELAAYGNVLVRGWGAATILQEKSHVIRVRVSASPEFRVSVLADRHPTWSKLSLQRLIDRSDSCLASNLEPVRGPGWRSDSHFHIAIRTDELSVADAARQIEQLAVARNPSCRDDLRGVVELDRHRCAAEGGRDPTPRGGEHVVDYPSIIRAERILLGHYLRTAE